jgi:hypothetical protein
MENQPSSISNLVDDQGLLRHSRQEVFSQADYERVARDVEAQVSDPKEMDKLVSKYRHRFGYHIDADNALELFPDYVKSHESRLHFLTAVIHPAIAVAKAVFDQINEEPTTPDSNYGVFLGGGSGSRKGSIRRVYFENLKKEGKAKPLFVYDSTLANYDLVKTCIDRTLSKKDRRVEILYGHLPVEEAAESVRRRGKIVGRLVPEDIVGWTHYGAQQSTKRLMGDFESESRVSVDFWDAKTFQKIEDITTQGYASKEDTIQRIQTDRKNREKELKAIKNKQPAIIYNRPRMAMECMTDWMSSVKEVMDNDRTDRDMTLLLNEIMDVGTQRILGHDLQLERTKDYFSTMDERCKDIPFLHESARDRSVEIQRSIDFKKPREGMTDEDIKRAIIISENDNPYGRLLESEISDNILKSLTPEMKRTAEKFAAFTLKILDSFVDTADDESKKKVLETFKNNTVIKACNLNELRSSPEIHHPLRNLTNPERNESIEQDLRDYLASPIEDRVSNEIFFHIITNLPRHINDIYDTPPIKWCHAAEEYEAQVVESIRNRERSSDGFYSLAKGINFTHNMRDTPKVEDGRKYNRAIDRMVLDIDKVKETTENRLHHGETFAADVSGHTMFMLFAADEANKQGYDIDPKYATLLLGAMIVHAGCHTWGEALSIFNHLSDALRFQKSVCGRHDLSSEEEEKIGEHYEKWAKLLPPQRSTEESRARDKEVNPGLSEAREILTGLLQKEHFVSDIGAFFYQLYDFR